MLLLSLQEYLERFGYMGEKSGDEEIEEMVDEDDVMRAALSNFQAMAGINITGGWMGGLGRRWVGVLGVGGWVFRGMGGWVGV